MRLESCLVVQVEGHTLALFADGDQIYALDNRCPHMGFPLHRGTLKDGILTCHWHHARFDLASGGTFDPWADDVRTFPVHIRDGDVWVDLAPHRDPRAHQRQRLRDGLERSIPLVIGKAAITLLDSGTEAAVVRELVEGGYEQVLRQLHARYQRGEMTFRAVAAELGLSVRELYDLFEQKGLPT